MGNIGQNWKYWYQQYDIYLIALYKQEESSVCKINILFNIMWIAGCQDI